MDELMQNRVSSVEAKLSSLLYACDFSSWKKPVVRALFPKSKVVFVKDASQVPADAVLVVWGYKPLPSPVRAGITVLRLEDGFLRSVGLGADLIQALVVGCRSAGHVLRFLTTVRPGTYPFNP